MVLLSRSLWRVYHSCLRAGHRGTLLSQPKYLPAPCQVQPKNRRGAFLGYILGYIPGIHPCAPSLASHSPCQHAAGREGSCPRIFQSFFFFFLQEESIEVK